MERLITKSVPLSGALPACISVATLFIYLFISSALVMAATPISISKIQGVWVSKDHKDSFIIHRTGNKLTLSATRVPAGPMFLTDSGWDSFSIGADSTVQALHFRRRSSLTEIRTMQLDDPENGPPSDSVVRAMAKAGLWEDFSGTLDHTSEGNLVMHVRSAGWHVHWTKDGVWNETPPPTTEEDFIHEISHIALDASVLFDFDRYELKPAADAALSKVKLSVIDKHPGTHLMIEGHTDDIGSETYNLTLSTKRALAVAKWMTLHGIEESRIEAKGYGKSRPKFPNTSDENRARNRRVEISVLAN